MTLSPDPREYVMQKLGEALLYALRNGSTQMSYQLSLVIKQLPESEWNWLLSTVIGQLEDDGISLVVDR